MGAQEQAGQHRGVSTAEARLRLVAVATRCLRSTEIAGEALPLRVMARQELRRNLGSVAAVLVLLLGYSLNRDKSGATLALALLGLCSLLSGVLIKVICERCETFELRDRVSEACEAFIENSPEQEEDEEGSDEKQGQETRAAGDTPLRHPWGPSAGLQQGNALASVVSVYRNYLWQRVPKLLLVEGDIVALMGGDRAPCKAEVLRLEAEGVIPAAERGASAPTATKAKVDGDEPPWVFRGTGVEVVGGQHIDLRPMAREHFNRKTMVPATSPDLLLLCGDMRCYRLLETPLDAHLKLSLSSAGAARPSSLLRERVRAAGRRCHSAVLIVALLAAVVGGIRLLLADGSRDEWPLFVLVIPGQVAVCLLPMSLPIYLAAGEAVATARVLAFLELMLRRSRESKGAAAGEDPVARPGAGKQGEEAHDEGTQGDEEEDEEEVDEFDQMDAEEREEAFSGTSHTVSWREARIYLFAVLRARWRCGTKSRICKRQRQHGQPNRDHDGDHVYVDHDCRQQQRQQHRPDSPSCYPASSDVGSAQAGRPASPRIDDDDDDDDNDATSGDATLRGFGRASSLSEAEAGRGGPGLSSGLSRKESRAVVATEGGGGDSSGWWDWWRRGRSVLGAGAAVGEPEDEEEARSLRQTPRLGRRRRRRQKTLLPVPMLRCGLVERLGAVTTLCMLDEDTVCQPTSAIKEVFLVDSKDDKGGGGSGTVLDMHTQQGSRGHKGVRFEDPHWWAHLPALKPIGLTCLLAERTSEQAKAKGATSTSTSRVPAAPGPGSSSPHRVQLKQSRPGPALLDHVRDNQPMEHLADLSRAIGFCDADRAMFRERRRIHVINPKLSASRATADTHAQGQDESRRRGTIQPHLTSVMAQDRRSGALQLLSQGNPSIVLGMCRDYWDGSAISNLPAALRKTILGMHQQWSLEDLDVVAFSYVPVPYTVTPFISSFNKHPDYLIHLSQSHGSSAKLRNSSGNSGSNHSSSSSISARGAGGPASAALSPLRESSRGEVSSGGAKSATAAGATGPVTPGGDTEDVPPAGEGTGVARSESGEDDKAAREGEEEGEGGGGGQGDGGGEREAQRGVGAPLITRSFLSPGCSPVRPESRMSMVPEEAGSPEGDEPHAGVDAVGAEITSPSTPSSKTPLARVLARGASESCLGSSGNNMKAFGGEVVRSPRLDGEGGIATGAGVAHATLGSRQTDGVADRDSSSSSGGGGAAVLRRSSASHGALGALLEDGAAGAADACAADRSAPEVLPPLRRRSVAFASRGIPEAEEAVGAASLPARTADAIQAAATTTAVTGMAPLRLSGSGISTTTATSTGGGGASKAGSGSRRYSMDDFGVQIAHRAELHTSNVAVVPASGETKMAEALWNLTHEQVFLGMAASFVPPKRDIVALIEDVEAAGVRFVYFSPRNMRRSKALAESMGIETDWNCAISLRPLEDSSQPDPHRMKSNYADWDVKARLPHGIAAIRDHIESVDNVPLLVSLFTDATPATTRDMLNVYQENDECTLAVGMSHRAVNADLFRAADLSFSVEGLPLNQPLSSLPVASASRFSAIDSAFNSSIVGLHTALPLGDVVRRGGAMVGLDDVGSVIIDLIREGRRLLTNTYQALSFLLLGSFGVSLLVLVSASVPISEPMVLGGDHLIWILWLVAPLLATSFLASPSDNSLMKRTPEKNDPKIVPIAARLVVHLLLRTIPTVLICVGLYVVLLAQFIVVHDDDLASSCLGESNGGADAGWMEMVWCLARDDVRGTKAQEASRQAVDLVLVELVLCLIAQSASFMYRTASIRKEPPWENWVWTRCVVLILCLQVLHLWAAAAARGTLPLLFKCRWQPLVAGAACPVLVLGVGELLKRNDARVYDRYITLLRLEFDTRLGMHSPR